MKPEQEKALSRRQLQVKLPEELREALDLIPAKKRNQLIRQWIAEGYSKYTMQQEQPEQDFEQVV